MRLLLAAACVTVSLAANGAELKSNYNDIVEQAKAEGELHFMASGETFGGERTFALLRDAFNKKYSADIDLRFTPGPSMPAMAARLRKEAQAGAPASTDLYLGNLASIVALQRDGTLAKIDWAKTFPGVTPEMEISKGAAVHDFRLYLRAPEHRQLRTRRRANARRAGSSCCVGTPGSGR